MINVHLKAKGLQTYYYTVKVSYGNIVGFKKLLGTKLDEPTVVNIITKYVNPNYTLEIQKLSSKGFPQGYYESYSIDSILSLVSRLGFIEVNVIKEPKIVYIDKIIKTELLYAN